MDFMSIIEDKIQQINTMKELEGISKVMIHIERAFKHFEMGFKDLDHEFYNDVIYRTNQAYEGILREAYKVFTNKNLDKNTLHSIEAYFSENEILNDRVKNLFTEYRKNWRNSSTHDHTLSFAEGEAVLAINTVISFIYLFINQIFEKIVYNNQMLEMNSEVTKIENKANKEFYEHVIDLLLEFTTNKMTSDFYNAKNEYEIAGKLNAFINHFDSEINVHREIAIGDERTFRADFILEKGEKKVIVELSTALTVRSKRLVVKQMKDIIHASKLDIGVLFIANDTRCEYEVEIYELTNDNCKLIVVSDTPRRHLLT